MALMRFNFVSVLLYLLDHSMVGLPIDGSALIHESNIQRNKQKNETKYKNNAVYYFNNRKIKVIIIIIIIIINFFMQSRHYHNLNLL
jgi:hypothetical protein